MDKMITLLDIGADYNLLSTIQALLENRAKVDEPDGCGRTALHYAADPQHGNGAISNEVCVR